MEGLVGSLAARMSKGNFRIAVEMEMLTRILATEVQLGKGEFDKLRIKSIQNVRQINGSIDILEAINDAAEKKSD